MNPVRYNIDVSEGSDFEKQFRLLDKAKVALNLTGATFAGEVLTEQGGTKIGDLTFDLSQLAQGYVIFKVPKALSSTFTLDKLWYFIEITWPSTLKVDRVLQGIVNVNLK